jgi:hypothetical protein
MKMKKQNKKSKTRRSSQLSSRNPSSQALIYRGPVTLPQEELATTTVLYDYPLTSSAGGVVSDVFADIPNGSPDWTGFSAVYSEYRILAFKIQFIPLLTGAAIAANLYNVLYIVWSTDASVTPLASYTDAVNHPVKRAGSLNQNLSLTHKMTGAEESLFVDVTSGVVDYTFKTFSTGLTPSTNYGRYLLTLVIQFRGRK